MATKQVKTLNYIGPNQIRTADYLVVNLGNSQHISIYNLVGGKRPRQIDIEFRSPEDYRNFMRDLEESVNHPDDLQGDITVEKLLEKTRVGWERGE